MNWPIGEEGDVRDAYGETLVRLGRKDPRIIVLEADLMKASGSAPFKAAFPERHFNFGIAEQNLVSVAAGFAASGKIPFASAFAGFLSQRACDQDVNAVCYNNLNVKLVGTYGGLTQEKNGGMHIGVEDLAIFRCMPNMSVVVPGFPAATTTAALSRDGRRVAVGATEPAGVANWVGDLERGTATQIAAVGRGAASPIWNPAGTKIAGPFQGGLRQIDAASGADSSFDVGDQLWHVPTSWSADGRTMILGTLTEGNRYDLHTFTPEPGARPKPYLGTTADEGMAVLSHDGRLLAYLSDASGRTELYVERFPSHAEAVRAGVPLANSALLENTVAWRADDRELYFNGGDGYTQYAAEVSTAPRLALGEPRALRQLPRDTRSVTIGRDGRVLVLLPEGSLARSFTVVQGWMKEKLYDE